MRIFLGAVLSVLLGASLAVSQAWAAQAFVVEDIRVEGLQRMSAGTVFNYLPVKVGEQLDDSVSAQAVRALFQTGFFQDVRLEREGNVLVVFVRERPAISSIEITGNKDIETEPLLDSLKQLGLAEGRVFDRSLLDKVEQELQRQYFSSGKYAVKITSTVSPLERNRVAIKIEVAEGKAARIRQINIVGNKVYDDATLLETFELSTPTMFSFFTEKDKYSKQKLAGDLESLRSYYQDRGYINFAIDSTQVSITPDKRDIYITINITEGDQFRISEVRLEGDLIVAPEELFPKVQVNAGDLFSRKRITDTINMVSKRLGEEGYAFANVNTIPTVDQEAKTVALSFFVDPGKRVYVRRVNMVGNYRTRDDVLRRELRQMEGGWFAGDKVERSRVRLQRLGFFETVNVETPVVPESPDQVDVNYSVSETSSGNLLLGVGFSQSSGFLLNASISQDNFLGSGKRVSFAFNNSSVNTIYSFSYLNPYYTIDGVSRGFGMFYRETDSSEANISDYNSDTYGGNVSFGIPINENDSVFLNGEYEHLDISTTSFTPTEVINFINANGDTYDILKATGHWAHDTRNRALFANRGVLQRFDAEITVPGLDLEFYKLGYRHLVYAPLTKSLTLSLNGEVAMADGLGGDELPFFENYYAGGVRSVRGFEDNTLGPRDSNNNPLGGGFKVVGNAELIFPLPFIKENHSFRMSAFVDAGNVYKTASDFEAADLRYSTGLSAIWISPLGPLSFSLAAPLNDKNGDQTQVFQFTLGTLF